MMGDGKNPVTKFGVFRFPEVNRFDAPELRLGVEACRLVGLDPDQLSLQAPFPRRLAGANEAWLENRGRIARFCAR
jgi:hypothetical protein